MTGPADRPTTEPRTAYMRARQFYNERNLPQPYYDLLDEAVAEAYDNAMVDAFDDVRRIDRAEAAQGAAPLDYKRGYKHGYEAAKKEDPRSVLRASQCAKG